MTLTLELSPERESLLKEAAARQGVSVPELAGSLIDEALQDLEQDNEDLTELRVSRISPDSPELHTLDELRAAIRGPKTNGALSSKA